jgi:5-methylcytosine-specific restriction protein A
MPRALKVCSTTGCHEFTKTSRCRTCETVADTNRGTATERGYGKKHRTRFRQDVLRRDPLCVCPDMAHGHGPQCLTPSRHADHHPLDKRELRTRGMDEHDPMHGRGLCESCHDKHTAQAQPGGWARRAV